MGKSKEGKHVAELAMVAAVRASYGGSGRGRGAKGGGKGGEPGATGVSRMVITPHKDKASAVAKNKPGAVKKRNRAVVAESDEETRSKEVSFEEDFSAGPADEEDPIELTQRERPVTNRMSVPLSREEHVDYRSEKKRKKTDEDGAFSWHTRMVSL